MLIISDIKQKYKYFYKIKHFAYARKSGTKLNITRMYTYVAVRYHPYSR